MDNDQCDWARGSGDRKTPCSGLLLRDYHCVLADPPAQGPSAPVANAPAAPDGAASRLQLPQLSSPAQPASSGHADGDAASSSRLLPQRRVTQQVMTHWLPHVQSSLAPPSDRNAILRRLHQKQEVEAAPDAEEGDPRHSILCAGMERNTSPVLGCPVSPPSGAASTSCF